MVLAPYLTSFLLPILVVAGNCLGGAWSVAGVILLFVVYPLIDISLGDRSGHKGMPSESRPWGELILRVHVLAQVCVVATLLWRVAQDGPGWMTFFATLGTGCVGGASGFIVAHELGHRRRQSLSWWLSKLNLLSVCYSHYTAEHNHNHHLHVGTKADPATAPLGRGLWAHVVQSVYKQFLSAWKIQGRGRLAWFRNPMFHALLLQVLLTVTFGIVFSVWASLAFLVQGLFAVLLLEYVNYIRHYGLRREPGEKQTEQHSWQTEARWTGWTLFEVSLHPDHHLRTNLSFVELSAVNNAPTLPVGYYGLFWVCVFPRLWRRLMDKRIPSLSVSE